MNKKFIFLSLFGAIILHIFIFAFGFEKNNVHTLSNNSKKIFNTHFVFLNLKRSKEEVKHASKKQSKRREKNIKNIKSIKKDARKKIIKTSKSDKRKEKMKQDNQAKNQADNLARSQEKNQAYNLKNLRNDYEKKLRKKLEENKIYPLLSKRMKEQGKVRLSFTILKSGVFEDVKIINSSGKTRLDKAGLETILRTKKFKSFPKELAENTNFLHISIAINFYIRN